MSKQGLLNLDGCSEIVQQRAVRVVEKFRSKLNVEPIGDAVNPIVFEDRGIEIDQAGPYQRVTPQVSAKVDRIGHAEALRLNIVV